MPIREAVEWIKDIAFDLWHILHPSKEEKETPRQMQWKAPAEQQVKCNVDGSFYEQSNQGGTGVVLRDHAGIF